jgi:uncharacterized damage-inducible protein DinB
MAASLRPTVRLPQRVPAASIESYRPHGAGGRERERTMRGSDLRRAARFNRWANRRLYEACNAVTPKQWKTSLAGAFGNLRDTLAHVAEVDLLWLARAGRQLPASVKAGAAIDLATLAEQRRAIDDALVLWTEVLGEDDLDRRLSYVDTEGVARDTPLGLALAHLFDHQTFHRGEASAMLAALGHEAPALDMLEFFDED